MKHTEESASAIAQRPQPLPTPTAVPVARSSREAERAERPRATESGGASSKPARDRESTEKRHQYEQAKAAKRAEAQRSERAVDEHFTGSLKIPGEVSPEDREKYERAKAAKGKSDLQDRIRQAEPATPDRSTREMTPELRARYGMAKAAVRDRELRHRDSQSQSSEAPTPPPPVEAREMRKEMPKDMSPEAQEKNKTARGAREVNTVAGRGENTEPKARSSGATSSTRDIPAGLREKYERARAVKQAKGKDTSSSPALIQAPVTTPKDNPLNGSRHKRAPEDNVDSKLSREIVTDQRTATKETSQQTKPSEGPVVTKVTKPKVPSKAALERQEGVRERGAPGAIVSPGDNGEKVESLRQSTNGAESKAERSRDPRIEAVNDGDGCTGVQPKSGQRHAGTIAGKLDLIRRGASRTHTSSALEETKPGEQPLSRSSDETDQGRGTAKVVDSNKIAEGHPTSAPLVESNANARKAQSENKETHEPARVPHRDKNTGEEDKFPGVPGERSVKARKVQQKPPEIRAKYKRMKAAKLRTQASDSDAAGNRTRDTAKSEHETPGARRRHDKDGGAEESVAKNSTSAATVGAVSSALIRPEGAGPGDSDKTPQKDAKRVPAITQPQAAIDLESPLLSRPDVRARSSVQPDRGTRHEQASTRQSEGSTDTRSVARPQGPGDVGSRDLQETAVPGRRRSGERGGSARVRGEQGTVNAETDQDKRKSKDHLGSDSEPPAYSSMPRTPCDKRTACRDLSPVENHQSETSSPPSDLRKTGPAHSVVQRAVEREEGVEETTMLPKPEVREVPTELLKRKPGKTSVQAAGPVQRDVREAVASDEVRMPKPEEVGLKEKHRDSGRPSERALSSSSEPNGEPKVEGTQDSSTSSGDPHQEVVPSSPPGPGDHIHTPAASSPQQRSDRESRVRREVSRRRGGDMVRDRKDDKGPRAGRSDEKMRAEVNSLTAETPEKSQNEVQRYESPNSPPLQGAQPPDHNGEDPEQVSGTVADDEALRRTESDRDVIETKPELTEQLGTKGASGKPKRGSRSSGDAKKREPSRQDSVSAASGQEQHRADRTTREDETKVDRADNSSRQASKSPDLPRPKGKERMTSEMVAEYEKYKALKQDQEAGRSGKLPPDLKEEYERLKARARGKESTKSRGVAEDEAHHSDPAVPRRLNTDKAGSRSPRVSARDGYQRGAEEGSKSREPSRREGPDGGGGGDRPTKVRLEDLTPEMVEKMQRARERRRLEKERAAKAALGQGSSGLSPVEKEGL
jgi:hypothetical protein